MTARVGCVIFWQASESGDGRMQLWQNSAPVHHILCLFSSHVSSRSYCEFFFFLRALLQVPARKIKKARTCFDRWRCSGVKHSWILVICDRTVDAASERHRQSSERQRQQPWQANGKGSEGADRQGDERESYEGESKTDWGARENKIQGANGLTFRLHTPTHLALKGICNCTSGQCVSPVPVAWGAELKHWQAKAARRYLLSEIESAQRTDPCWHISSRPCQPYLIVPIATCRTISPDKTGCGT